MVDESNKPLTKPLRWVASSREELRRFPQKVRGAVGHALYLAQIGMKAPDAKPQHGFGGAGVLEVMEDFIGSTYRAVYTVKFKGAVYVLHVFQKKSKKGAVTPRSHIDLIKQRLKAAADEERRRSETK